MNFTAIVSGIFAIARAIPAIKDLIEQIVDKYIKDKVAAIDINRVKEADQRAA